MNKMCVVFLAFRFTFICCEAVKHGNTWISTYFLFKFWAKYTLAADWYLILSVCSGVYIVTVPEVPMCLFQAVQATHWPIPLIYIISSIPCVTSMRYPISFSIFYGMYPLHHWSKDQADRNPLQVGPPLSCDPQCSQRRPDNKKMFRCS